MPTKMKMTIKVGDEWVDASHVIAKDFVWHKKESNCKWYANKISGAIDPDYGSLSCEVVPSVKANTNFLYAAEPEKPIADTGPIAVLILGAIIAIMAWNVWKKM